MRTTTNKAIETALKAWQDENGKTFPGILDYEIGDAIVAYGYGKSVIEEDESEDAAALAREMVRDLEERHLVFCITEEYAECGVDIEDEAAWNWAHETHLNEIASEDELRKEIARLMWEDSDRQGESRLDCLVGIAEMLLSKMTGIDEDDIVFGVERQDIVEALQLDNLDYYYIHGFMPDSPQVRPFRPQKYPECSEVEDDIQKQIDVFGYDKQIARIFAEKNKN